jgi:glycosyltransferase involved in cell wall biosynthesis
MNTAEKHPLITVVNLCYNTSKHILKTLDSVKNQTFKNFELIIVDDASTDNSISIIQEWINQNNYQCTFIKNEKNLGICKSLNIALDKSCGTYFTVIGDDIWHSDFLEATYNCLHNSSDKVALVYTDASIFFESENKYDYSSLNPLSKIKSLHYDRENNLIKKIDSDTYLINTPYLYDILLRENIVLAFCVLIKKNLLLESGKYNESLSYEDYDKWLDLSQNYSFLYLDKIKADYIIHFGNFTITRRFSLESDEIRILLKNVNKTEYPDTRKIIGNKIKSKHIQLYKNFYNNAEERNIIYDLNKSISEVYLFYNISFYFKICFFRLKKFIKHSILKYF